MKSLFTALMAVFFMFTVYGCSDDTETETSSDVVVSETTEDAGSSDDVEVGESEDAVASPEEDSTNDSAEGESE